MINNHYGGVHQAVHRVVKQLEAVRLARGLTDLALAVAAGFGPMMMWKWRSGRQQPLLPHVEAALNVVGLTLVAVPMEEKLMGQWGDKFELGGGEFVPHLDTGSTWEPAGPDAVVDRVLHLGGEPYGLRRAERLVGTRYGDLEKNLEELRNEQV